MYGFDTSNTLTVLAKRPSSEEQLWKKIGMQSPSWLGAAITVAKPAGQSVEVGIPVVSSGTHFLFPALSFLTEFN